MKYTDPTGMWINNGDGTYTAEEGDTLWGLYGDDWREKSGYEGDPTKLQVGQVVGFKKNATYSTNSDCGVSARSGNENLINPEYSKIGISAKAALILGLGVEVGYTWDSTGQKAIYISGSVGTGFLVGILNSESSLAKQILELLISGGIGGTSGTIQNGAESSLTGEGGVLITGVWDLNNGGDFIGLGGISVGGGIFKTWTLLIPLSKK